MEFATDRAEAYTLVIAPTGAACGETSHGGSGDPGCVRDEGSGGNAGASRTRIGGDAIEIAPAAQNGGGLERSATPEKCLFPACARLQQCIGFFAFLAAKK